MDRVEEIRSLPIYLMPLIEEPPPVRRAEVPAPTIRSQPVPAESTAITLTEPQQVPAVENTPVPLVDWAKEAATAIQNMAQSGSGAVTFGDRPQDEAPSVKAPYGVFEKRSPRKAGYVEEIAPGITRKWVNERCYREFGHLPELFADQGPKVNPVRCLAGPGPVFGDLFDHLKPKYLKQK
jgi:hypothetical protein